MFRARSCSVVLGFIIYYSNHTFLGFSSKDQQAWLLLLVDMMLIFHRLTSSWGFPQVSCPLCCILLHRGRYSENKVFIYTKQFPHQGPNKDMGTRITPNVHHATKSSMLLIAWIEVAYNCSKCNICTLFDLGNCFFPGMIIILDSGPHLPLTVC